MIKFFKTMTLVSGTIFLATNAASALTAEARDEIGRAAVDYMKNNPKSFTEIVTAVQEHSQKIEKKRQLDLLAKHQDDLFKKITNVPIIGNKKGTTEIVLFMDPFCHFCRKFEKTIKVAIKENKNIKFISRDIAIMHPKSIMLIKALLAADRQGKYMEMQTLVHKVTPKVESQDLLKFAADLKMDVTKFKADMDDKKTTEILKSNMDLADNLNIEATPTFIIKGKKSINAGYVSFDELKILLKK